MPIHFYFLWYIQLIMVLKHSDTEGSVFGALFHRKSRIQILCKNLRITSNIGKMKAATANFAGSTFLGSDFYSIYTIFNMNFVNWYELCNFIDLFSCIHLFNIVFNLLA